MLWDVGFFKLPVLAAFSGTILAGEMWGRWPHYFQVCFSASFDSERRWSLLVLVSCRKFHNHLSIPTGWRREMPHCGSPGPLQWYSEAVGSLVTVGQGWKFWLSSQPPVTSLQLGGGSLLLTTQLGKIQCPTQPSLTSPQQEYGVSHCSLVRMEFKLCTQTLLVRNSPLPDFLEREQDFVGAVFCLHPVAFLGCWLLYFQAGYRGQEQNSGSSPLRCSLDPEVLELLRLPFLHLSKYSYVCFISNVQVFQLFLTGEIGKSISLPYLWQHKL